MISYDEKNKRYRISVTQFGKRKWFSARTKKEAKEIEARELLRAKQGFVDDDLIFDVALEKFLSWKEKSKRKTTVDFYRVAFEKRITPSFSRLSLSTINVVMLENWKNSVDESLSLGRKQQLFICLHAFFKYCDTMYGTQLLVLLNKVGNFARNPNEVSVKTKALHFWTPEEFQKVADSMRSHCEEISEFDYRFMPNWSAYVFLNILFYAGLRRGEANALKVSDFHDDGISPYLDVNKSITQKAKGVDWLLTDPKNKNSIRCVPVSRNLAIILREHLHNRIERLGFSDTSNLYLVGGIRPLSDNTFNEIKKREELAVNVPHIRTHDLRHSFASVLINNGVQPDVVQKLMGHSSISITLEIYSHLYPKTMTSALSVFDAVTSPIVQKIDSSR